MKRLYSLIFFYSVVSSAIIAAFASFEAKAATVLQYHHVSETTPFDTSITPVQFEAHMQMLKQSGREVVSMQTLVKALREQKPIPHQWTVITFDDGYDNILKNATPILNRYGFPYTIFVSPGNVDMKLPSLLTWQELRELKKQGVMIANHSMLHDYLVRGKFEESPIQNSKEAQGAKRALADILQAQRRLEEENLAEDKLFAYPYGEFNQPLMRLLAEHGFISFGQHSGAIGSDNHLQRLPRYPASGRYTDTEKLKQKLFTRAFSIDFETLPDMVQPIRMPELVIQFKQMNFNHNQLSCFSGGEHIKNIKWLNDNQVSIKASEPWSNERHRFNCTAPVPNTKPAQFYWFSQPWLYLESSTPSFSKFQTRIN